MVSPLPDSGEDDGRPIAGLTLEAIANEIAKTYTASQLPTFLRDSEIPDQFVPRPVQGDKSSYVALVLTSMHEAGSDARRALRRFIARWLSGQLHVPPSEKVSLEIVGHLGQQGWHIRGDSLAIGDRIAATAKPGNESPAHTKGASPEALVRSIRQRISDGKELRATLGRVITDENVEQVNVQYRQWHDGNRQVLISSGRNDLLEAYDRRRFASKTPIGGTFRDSVREADDDIRISLERLLEIANDKSLNILARPVTDIEKIADRIDIVARQLADRKRGRSPFVIKDEYDLQDLIHSLLRLLADDVRPEEWTPSYAGNSSRADFLIPIEETVVEAKFAQAGHGNREIANELAIDIERYRKLKECKHLICIVYDPDGVIKNPVGFESDLARSEPMQVSVWVRPTR